MISDIGSHIVIVSKLFTIRECIQECIKENFSDYKVYSKRRLKDVELENLNILLVDISTENIEDIIKIKEDNYNLKIVIIDENKIEYSHLDMVTNYIDGYVVDLEEREDFINVMKQILRGKKYYDVCLIEKIINNFNESERIVDKLTSREEEILACIKKGYTNKKISNDLYITENTVKKHVTNILNKLQVKNRKDLIIMAQK